MKEILIKVKKNCDTRILKGSPWIFSNEIENFSELKNLEKGCLLKVKIRHDQIFALAYFNPQSLISARIISNNPDDVIDQKFFVEK